MRLTTHSSRPAAPRAWNARFDGLALGGDYNPEQWSSDVQVEDVELMQAVGVNLVSVGIFSWATIEPREGELEFAWLDDVMDRLDGAGVKVALATATASPPPWLTRAHPEILPQTADGTVLHQGGRQSYSVHHPLHRQHALRLTRLMAQRFGDHPALALWHVDNEIGCHVPRDYSPAAADAFRTWLRERYEDIDALNEAWGTAFWSQRYAAFDDVLPPLTAPTFANPTQQLDFHRFSSDALLDYFLDLRAVLAEAAPDVPITTNLMATSSTKWMDYFSWAPHLDVVASDHYTISDDPRRHVELSFSADLARGVGGGQPWMLMEQSTSAVNWQHRNRAKAPGELLRNSLAHVARGADAVMFFQWRQSKAGAEKFHSAMVPHAGTNTRVHREVTELGQVLQRIAQARGSTVAADVAIVMDYPAWWASELDSHPTNDFDYMQQVRAVHTALWDLGVTADLVPPGSDLGGYRLVVIPALYLVADEDAANVAAYVEAGGHVLATWFSGVVDEHDHVRLGGYPGAFRDLLGIWTEEFHPLQRGEPVCVAGAGVGGTTTAQLWTEHVHAHDAEVLAVLDDGPLQGSPAITRRRLPEAGSAWYQAVDLPPTSLQALMQQVCEEAGVTPQARVERDVEVVRRHRDGRSWLFIINHRTSDHEAAARGRELLTDTAVDGTLVVPAGGVRVVEESTSAG